MGVLWTSTAPTASWKRPVGKTGVNAGATFTTLHKLRASGATSGAPSGVTFGASPGGNGASPMNSMVAALGPAMVRTYDGGLSATFGTNAQGQYVPSGIWQHASVRPDLTTMATSGTTAYNNLINACRTNVGGMPDVAGNRMSVWHEPYHNSLNPVNWSACQVNFKHDVIDWVNANTGRSNQIIFNCTIEGFTLRPAYTAAFNSYFTAAVLALGPELGFDCYAADQQDLGAAYAAAHGLNWSIPEYGQLAGGTTGDADDASAKAFMQANVPRLSTLSNPPQFAAWFNNNGSLITGLPTHAAADYWQSIT